MGDVIEVGGTIRQTSDLSKREGGERETSTDDGRGKYRIVKCLGRGTYEMLFLDNNKKKESKETESKETDSKETDTKAADAGTNETKQNEAGDDTSEKQVIKTYKFAPSIPALATHAVKHSGDVMTPTDGSHILYITLAALGPRPKAGFIF